MSGTHDNWERLVRAALHRAEYLQLCLDSSRSPSTASFDSDSSTSSTKVAVPVALAPVNDNWNNRSSILKHQKAPPQAATKNKSAVSVALAPVDDNWNNRSNILKHQKALPQAATKYNSRLSRDANKRTNLWKGFFMLVRSMHRKKQVSSRKKLQEEFRESEWADVPRTPYRYGHELMIMKSYKFKDHHSERIEKAKLKAESTRFQEIKLRDHIGEACRSKGIDVDKIKHYHTI